MPPKYTIDYDGLKKYLFKIKHMKLTTKPTANIVALISFTYYGCGWYLVLCRIWDLAFDSFAFALVFSVLSVILSNQQRDN